MILIIDPPFESLGLRRDSRRRVRFFAIADQNAPLLIDYGVLFVMAWWSGSARVSFRLLREAFERFDPDEQMELAIVDIDRSDDLFEHSVFGNAPRGVGEIAWIVSGKILKAAMAPTPDEVEQLTKWLIWRGPAR